MLQASMPPSGGAEQLVVHAQFMFVYLTGAKYVRLKQSYYIKNKTTSSCTREAFSTMVRTRQTQKFKLTLQCPVEQIKIYFGTPFKQKGAMALHFNAFPIKQTCTPAVPNVLAPSI